MVRRAGAVALVSLLFGFACSKAPPVGGASGGTSGGPGGSTGSAGSTGAATGGGSSGSSSGGASAQVTGYVFARNGLPIAGAEVALVGGGQTTTASDGSFQLAAAAGSVVLDVNAAGYVENGRSLTLAAGEVAVANVYLSPSAPPQALDATAGGTVTGPRGASITFPGGALVDSTGATVSGAVQVSLTPMTPGYPGELASYPGDLRGVDAKGNVQTLATVGAMGVQITQNGKTLELAPGKTAQVTLPASILGNLPTTVDMWYFDHATALWTQNGVFTLDGGAYVGASNHFSAVNGDCGVPPFCVKGELDDCAGNPIQGIDAQVDVWDDTTTWQGELSQPAQFHVALPVLTGDGGAPPGAFSPSSNCNGSWPARGSSWNFNASWKGLVYSFPVPAGNSNADPQNGLCDMNAAWFDSGKHKPVACSDGGGPFGAANPGAGGENGTPPGGLLGIGDAGPCELWPVDGGFQVGDSGTIVADPFAGTCAAPLTQFFQCTQTSGTCTASQPLAGGQITYTYANGASQSLRVTGSSALISYTSATGQSCGAISASGSGAADILLNDDTAVYAFTQTLVICPDGGTVDLTPEQQQAAQACSPIAGALTGSAACSMQGKIGTACQSDTDCGGIAQTVCCPSPSCGGLCLLSQLCGTYASEVCCPAKPCTTSGDVCCSEQGVGFPLCIPTAGCNAGGAQPECGPTNPCADGGVCCTPASSTTPVCLPAGGFCPSQCSPDAGTGAGGCPSGSLCCEAIGTSYSECLAPGTSCPAACMGNADCADGGACCSALPGQLYGYCVILGDGGPSGPVSCPVY